MLIRRRLQLCATGTVGVAAIGFAFGHPQHSMATRATESKRRAITRDMLQVQRPTDRPPSTASPAPQPASAPTSRLRKRRSYGWPTASSSKGRSGTRTVGSTPDKLAEQQSNYSNIQDSPTRESYRWVERRSFTFESKVLENVYPSKPRPRSTMSSLRTGSPHRASPPGSASMSQSNGSTAPILPGLGDFAPETPSRNKLVKRSSSHRALSGGSNLYSALRRPATSYQRSATLQRQNLDRGDSTDGGFHSSPLSYNPPEHHDSVDDASQRWRPFFKPQFSRDGDTTLSRKRNISGNMAKHDSPPAIVPDLSELPTLLLATSISTSSSDEPVTRRPSNLSGLSRPFTPVGLDTFETPSPQSREPKPPSELDDRPRTSFSFSEMFPSPSPLTWKMPRTGSSRNKRLLGRAPGGRRIVSAPQFTKTRTFAPPGEDDNTLGNHTHIYASPDNDASRSMTPPSRDNVFQRSPSSPLPPLNRLSSFQVELPDSIPSYPTSPQLDLSSRLPQKLSRPSSPSMFPLGQLSHTNQAYHPSGTHSEHASTLLGSDNDNSRILSGDEDDMDARSSTIYDSTRTGATGSSQSGTKRPHIDTIFDESPPNLLPEENLSALKKLHIADVNMSPGSLGPKLTSIKLDAEEVSNTTSPRIKDEVRTVTQVSTFCPNTTRQDGLSPVEDPSYIAASLTEQKRLEGTPTQLASAGRKRGPEESERSPGTAFSVLGDLSSAERSRSRRSTPRRRESPPGNPRLNPFEWSEKTSVDRESPQADSGRPKTVHGKQGKEARGHRLSGRRGPPPLHLRSQSVPVPNDNRGHGNGSKLDGWILGNKGPSEDWDGDFDFEEGPRTPKPVSEELRPNASSGMLVPRAILERQASVHGQFGQVKELTKLVEDLKRLQQQAKLQGIIGGQAIELWKEAEGIINLATLDEEEQDLFPAHSPSVDFDFFDEDSPTNRRQRSEATSPKDDESTASLHDVSPRLSPRPSYDRSNPETPLSKPRQRKQSSAKAKTVLESIHQQRTHYDPALLDAKITQKKLPFDTTSLKDLVTRAGVVTRALKEEVRRAENRSESPAPTPDQRRPDTPPDPPFSQMFQKPSPPASFNKSPRVTQSPKSPKSSRSSILGGSITGNNDNEINGHMKLMTVV